MEFRELRYFLGVAKERNITKAAELLNTTQPNLTRQIKNLEWEIGKPLFIRGKRQLTLENLVYVGSESELRFRPLEPQLLSPLYLVWKKFAVLSPAARAFLDELKPLTAEL